MIKEEQIEELDMLVKQSESILESEIVEQQKIDDLRQEAERVIASLGQYKRFFKRLS